MAHEIKSTTRPLITAFVAKTLEQGIEFFDLTGEPLASEAEVLRALLRDGTVQRRRRHHTLH